MGWRSQSVDQVRVVGHKLLGENRCLYYQCRAKAKRGAAHAASCTITTSSGNNDPQSGQTHSLRNIIRTILGTHHNEYTYNIRWNATKYPRRHPIPGIKQLMWTHRTLNPKYQIHEHSSSCGLTDDIITCSHEHPPWFWTSLRTHGAGGLKHPQKKKKRRETQLLDQKHSAPFYMFQDVKQINIFWHDKPPNFSESDACTGHKISLLLHKKHPPSSKTPFESSYCYST